MNYLYNKQNKLSNCFILSNYVMNLDLSATALAIYCYLMYIEDRETYECYPSYKTIGKALKIKSQTTVGKYVKELEDNCLIYTEQTHVVLKNGKKQYGNLKYKIRPIRDALEYNFQKQLKENADRAAREKAQKKLEEYDRKHPKSSS
ncbi:MAG: helix-turn-helix domain-containing protein [Ruminococcaceae bacterium]|nr:helix-turn-helix domain-containing protein [Oscillospiraceae bacterium]